ncbi:MAG: hypothetical protein WCI74_11405, partial [Actinomycetes bacterium]
MIALHPSGELQSKGAPLGVHVARVRLVKSVSIPQRAQIVAGVAAVGLELRVARVNTPVEPLRDIAEVLAAARANAQSAGVPLRAVIASYDTFDFGRDQWDLIVLAFAWAPVKDPAFVTRLHSSLRPGGRVVFEHFVRDEAPGRPDPV